MTQIEHPRKRHDITRWRVNRLRRLLYEQQRGRATERQKQRINQLQMTLDTKQPLE